MRIVLIVLGLIALLVLIAAIAIRRLDHDAGVWHVDPLTAPTPSTPNSYRVAPVDATIDTDAVAPIFDMPADELAVSFDRVARADRNVDVVGGSSSEAFVTYVQTSGLFGFPDYVSVRFIELDAGRSTLAVFSRSRLGQSDLGVNKKRVERWLGAI
jgi:uncharacterized protein (DUF1499 family)